MPRTVSVPYATGGPWAGVPARGTADTKPSIDDLRIRAWVEGANARVLVFAVAGRTSTVLESGQETQIASIALAPGESVVLLDSDQYHVRPVTITASIE